MDLFKDGWLVDWWFPPIFQDGWLMNSSLWGLSTYKHQAGYIFSDKTGTLTQNIMELKRVAILGQAPSTIRGLSQAWLNHG